MSFFGSSFGQLSNASFAASAKISLAYIPSSLPNFDKPAETIEARGFPFICSYPLLMCALRRELLLEVYKCRQRVRLFGRNEKRTVENRKVGIERQAFDYCLDPNVFLTQALVLSMSSRKRFNSSGVLFGGTGSSAGVA